MTLLVWGMMVLTARAQPYTQVSANDLLRLQIFWNDHENLTCVATDNNDVGKLGSVACDWKEES